MFISIGDTSVNKRFKNGSLTLKDNMAKLRKFVAYRGLERPYTRISKYKKKSFIKTTANIKIVRFNTGNLKKKFPYSNKFLQKQENNEAIRYA